METAPSYRFNSRNVGRESSRITLPAFDAARLFQLAKLATLAGILISAAALLVNL